MTSIADAITYPTEDDEWLKTVLIGGVLSIFGFLLIPTILVYGYVVRVLRHSLAGEAAPPRFDDWGGLLVDGLKAAVVGFVYMLIPAAVGAVAVGGSLAAIATGSRSGAAAGLGALALGALLTFVLALLFGYVAVVAVVNFAHEGDLGAGFDVGTIKHVALSGDYAVPWALSVAVFVGAGLVVGVLNVVPILGTLVGAFVLFYAQVAAARLWADGYAAAREGAERTDRAAVDERAI